MSDACTGGPVYCSGWGLIPVSHAERQQTYESAMLSPLSPQTQLNLFRVLLNTHAHTHTFCCPPIPLRLLVQNMHTYTSLSHLSWAFIKENKWIVFNDIINNINEINNITLASVQTYIVWCLIKLDVLIIIDLFNLLGYTITLSNVKLHSSAGSKIYQNKSFILYCAYSNLSMQSQGTHWDSRLHHLQHSALFT